MNKDIFFIVPMYDTVGPRSIRFNSVIPELNRNNSLRIKIFKLPINKTLNDNEVNVTVPNYLKFTFFGENKIFRFLSFIFSIFFVPDIKILLLKSFIKKINQEISNNGDFTIVVTRPFSFYLLGYFIKNKYPSVRTILDMGDPFYNNSADSKNYLYKKYFEAFCLKYYDDIIVTNQLTKKFIIDLYKFQNENIHIIPQGGLKKIQSGEYNKNVNINSTISVVYAGAFYKKLREPYNYLNAISQIPGNSIKSTFIGVSKNWTDGFENVISIDRLSNDKVHEYYEDCDLILFVANQYGIQTSGKIFELLVLNKPLLIISNKERFFLFEEYVQYPGVFLVENATESIKRFFFDVKQTTINCDRRKYQDLFTWENRARLYEKILLTEFKAS